jgi:hypothetical protein
LQILNFAKKDEVYPRFFSGITSYSVCRSSRGGGSIDETSHSGS